MKMKNAFARIAILAVAMAALSVCALAQTEETRVIDEREALAAKPVEQQLDFSMFGATRGQTVRLNVMFIVGGASQAQAPSIQIQAELILLDGQGALLKKSVETLSPRQGASLELDMDSPARPDNRSDLQPCIRILIGSKVDVPIQVIGSVEVVDNATGR